MTAATAVRPTGLAQPAAVREGFRSDINGLRAVAVALVMAFHLGRGHLGGGYAGVDVFFAISGYLMTRIIVGGLETGHFALRGFYLARVRRIWPALVVFCAGLWLVGATLLDPWTFERLAAKLPYALLFVSNFAFAGHGGYFAEDARTSWFLHTWSLGVEWQFYLLYPLLLIGLWRWKRGRRWLWPLLALVAAASFALTLAALPHNMSLSFYMLPTRAWELILGGLCVPIERRMRWSDRMRFALHLAGLALIGLGAALAGPDTPWPSALTLVPVGGSALVIAAGARRTFWAENPVVAGLGRASYSVYLWHWPIVVWLYDNGVRVTWLVAFVALTAMIALGACSYWLVERRVTDWLFRRGSRRWAIGGVLAAATLALAVVAVASHGLEALRTFGAPAQVRAALADDRRAVRDWAYPQVCAQHSVRGRLELCTLGDPAARQVLLIGDSHAQEMAPRYVHAFDGQPGQGLTLLTIAGCIPIPGVSGRGARDCGQAWREAYRYAETAGFRRVAILAGWQLYFDPTDASPLGLAWIDEHAASAQPRNVGAIADAAYQRLADEVRRLQARGAQVVLIGATPRYAHCDPHWLYARTFRTGQVDVAPQSRAAFEARNADNRRRLAWLARTTGAPLVDPLDSLCVGDACPATENGRPLYKDYGHFRASMMTRPLFAFLDRWLDPEAPAATPGLAPK